jgi:hypothetical protein
MHEKGNSVTHTHQKLSHLHTRIHRKKNFFPGQRESEEVQLCIRTHWIQRAGIFFWFFVLAIIAPGGIMYLLSFIDLPEAIWLIINLVLIFYLLFAWVVTFVEFIKSEFTMVVATNERIADIVQTSLFNQQISETSLDRIQEVGGFTRGMMRASLDIGRLEIQTAGSDVPLVMKYVKSPQLTARKILDIQRESQQRRRGSDFEKRGGDQAKTRQGEDISQKELARLRGSGIMDNEKKRKPPESV